jgi:hypothetical protein
MATGFHPRDPEVMLKHQQAHMQHDGVHPASGVLQWPRRYAFPAAIVGAGITVLLLDLSAGIGWALLVFGLSFLTLVFERPTAPTPGAGPDHGAVGGFRAL